MIIVEIYADEFYPYWGVCAVDKEDSDTVVLTEDEWQAYKKVQAEFFAMQSWLAQKWEDKYADRT